MLFKDAFKTAIRSLTHGKMRSILTVLGIVIGIASVIILMSIGQSAQQLILNQVQSIGSNLIFIVPGAPSNGRFSAPASAQGIVITSLNERDLNSLEREPSISMVAAEVRGQASVVYGNNSATISYEGVTENFLTIRNLEVGKGRAFNKSDVDGSDHVAIIGPELATTLFGPYVDPINKNVRIKDISFRVIGVLSKGGTGPFGVDQGNLVIIPVTTAQRQLLGISYYNDVIVSANGNYDIDFVKQRVTFILRQNHAINSANKEDFTIRTQEDALSLLGNVTSILTLFLAAIAGISLIVGGIGIMNIMLVAVTERTKEIGLRKAVGATDRDIIKQFLIESVLLTVSGGIIGILLGALVVGALYFVLSTFFSIGWVFAFPLSAVLLALAVATIAGLAFGIYPARQAAKKNPIEALRYE